MRVRGSMTLEAAFIVPVVMILMLLSIQYAVYIHDIAACQSFLDNYELADSCAIEKIGSVIQGNGYVEISSASRDDSFLFRDMGARLSYIGSCFGKPVEIELYKKSRQLDPVDIITQVDFIDDLIDEKWYNESSIAFSK